MSEARGAALTDMATAFTTLHELAPIVEVIYLASAGKGTSPWDAWSWSQGVPSPEGLALFRGGGEVDPAVEKARTSAPGHAKGTNDAASASHPFSILPLDAKQAPKTPKLVPALKTLVDTLEAARA